MYINISNPDEYTDNVFGEMIMINLSSSWYDSAIVLFKEHAFVIVKSKKNPDSYDIISSSYKYDIEDNYIVLNRSEKVLNTVETYKNIGYKIISICREIYSEYQGFSFPINEFRINFFDNLDNYVCSQNY